MAGRTLKIIALCFLICCTLILGGCGEKSQKTENIYRIAGDDYGYPAPYAYYPRGPGYCRMSLIFDTLLWKDENGSLIPALAKEYAASPDGKVWTFKLDTNAKWHDGQPVTGEDIKFTVDYMQKNPHPSFTSEVRRIDKVTVNGSEVKFYLKKPYAPFLSNIAANVPILPQHIWSGVSDPLKFTDAKSVIGSGPFKLKQYDKASAVYIYEANKDYYQGKVLADQLIFTKPGQPLLALTKGDIDAFEPSVDQIKVLEKNSEIKIAEGSGFWVYRLMFNLKQEPFSKIKFRQAVAHALNLPDLVERAVHGGAVPGSAGYVSPELEEWYNPQIVHYAYNLTEADKILNELGYIDRDGDGIREMPDGSKLSFELVCFSEGKEAEVVKEMLKQTGIELRLKACDKGTHDTLVAEGQYQLALEGHGGIGGDPAFLNSLIFSQNEKKHSRDMYQNKEYIALAEKQLETMDYESRKNLVFQMQAILAEELPTIPLYYRKSFLAYHPGKINPWFFTKGGIASGIPTSLNKLVFIEKG